MKLKLNKKKIKSLTADAKSLPAKATPAIAGGYQYTHDQFCRDFSFGPYLCLTDESKCKTTATTNIPTCYC
ncbi:hypothetical protein [Pseudoalteromonas umbrosa]|uniref:hypothetical protein n=1 Tax=Pseudoalteromonas umbrosa TaxID=3048489 RepID=UPI0024C2B576|nr:hypothetical protein [Pseudoalteromonas sp. B95]MDK1288706.1 hypothetical protein [Pseudoalteromonas sp. B95]